MPSARVNWTAPANGGSAITGYQLERNRSGGGFTLLASPTGTTYLDSAAVDGDLYRVRAVNANGPGPWSGTGTYSQTGAAKTATAAGSWVFLGAAVGAAPSSGTITHGRQITTSGSNTGIAQHGLTSANLTAHPGGTISTAGTTLYRRLITNGLTIAAANVTLDQCEVTTPQGDEQVALNIVEGAASNTVLRDCKIAVAGLGGYKAINYVGDGLLVDGCDISNGENILDCSGTTLTIRDSWLHDAATTKPVTGNPATDPHFDVVEIMGGGPHVIERSRFRMRTDGDNPINIAPWWPGTNVTGVDIFDNYFDGGSEHLLHDTQQPSPPHLVQNVRVLRNAMTGRTAPAYTAIYNKSNAPYVQTQAALTSNPNAILWPTSGPDVNVWEDTITAPLRDGQVVTP